MFLELNTIAKHTKFVTPFMDLTSVECLLARCISSSDAMGSYPWMIGVFGICNLRAMMSSMITSPPEANQLFVLIGVAISRKRFKKRLS